MKVTFIFSGLPHYLIALLNKLVHVHGLDVSVIIPEKRGISIGEGVKLEDADLDYLFTVDRVEEYRGMLGKPYFRNLNLALNRISPDILIIGWPFILNLFFDIKTRRVLKRNKISLVYREIPFMVAPRNKALQYYRKHPVMNENLEVENPTGLMFYPWAIALNQMRIRYYRMADATMIYSSPGVEIHESFGIPRERIFITFNSPDTDNLAIRQKQLRQRGVRVSNPKRILHLGRLVKWKRVDLLIEAIGKLSGKHDTIELVVIGAGPEEENLKKLAAQKVPGDRVRFLGSIYDPEALATEIISSAIYVLAGMGGLSINEAMAFGLPVICSRCDGTETDLVEDGVNGFFFEEGSAADLAVKIDTLLNDPDRTREMGNKALSVIQDKINLDTVVQRYMDCFQYVMKKKA